MYHPHWGSPSPVWSSPPLCLEALNAITYIYSYIAIRSHIIIVLSIYGNICNAGVYDTVLAMLASRDPKFVLRNIWTVPNGKCLNFFHPFYSLPDFKTSSSPSSIGHMWCVSLHSGAHLVAPPLYLTPLYIPRPPCPLICIVIKIIPSSVCFSN